MWNINETVERPSGCLSHNLPAARRCGGFAAERRAGRRYQSTAAAASRCTTANCTQQQMRKGRQN